MNAKEAREYAEDSMYKYCIDTIKQACAQGLYMYSFQKLHVDEKCQDKLRKAGYSVTANASTSLVLVKW